MLLTPETKAGDIIQDADTGDTAKVLYIGKFLHTNNTLLIVSPTDQPQLETENYLVINACLIPSDTFDMNAPTEELIAGTMEFGACFDMALGIELIIYNLAHRYYEIKAAEITQKIMAGSHEYLKH